MRMFIVVPPHTRPFWLKIVARNLALKHPDAVVIGPIDDRLRWHLQRYRVNMIDPPTIPPKPARWWGRMKWWWAVRGLPKWNSFEKSDIVLILCDNSDTVVAAMHRTHTWGKKMWVVRMVD